MELDYASHITLVESLGTSIPTSMRESLVYSFLILCRDYRLNSAQIVAVMRSVNTNIYIICKTAVGYFFTMDGRFWSPLPILSKEDCICLENVGYGLLSTKPIIGDPSIILTYNKANLQLTELHRISMLIYHWDLISIRPKGSSLSGVAFQGLAGSEAGNVSEGFELLADTTTSANTLLFSDLIKINGEITDPITVKKMEDYYKFDHINLSRDWVPYVDPHRHFVVYRHKIWKGLCAYSYWRSRVFNWLYSPQEGCTDEVGIIDKNFIFHSRQTDNYLTEDEKKVLEQIEKERLEAENKEQEKIDRKKRYLEKMTKKKEAIKEKKRELYHQALEAERAAAEIENDDEENEDDNN